MQLKTKEAALLTQLTLCLLLLINGRARGDVPAPPNENSNSASGNTIAGCFFAALTVLSITGYIIRKKCNLCADANPPQNNQVVNNTNIQGTETDLLIGDSLRSSVRSSAYFGNAYLSTKNFHRTSTNFRNTSSDRKRKTSPSANHSHREDIHPDDIDSNQEKAIPHTVVTIDPRTSP